nr:SAM-dependent methyltransferase [uncultured Draconibacterium sp.]
MLLEKKHMDELNDLFYVLKLQDKNNYSSINNKVKIEQVLAYLEIIHAELRKFSKKRKLVILDSAAGNCYLSFVVYYFYSKIDKRNIEIHCIDYNQKLMKNNQELAQKLGLINMHFHSSDIIDFQFNEKVDLVYSLHACDTATDKTMHLGIRCDSKIILSVACCQHSLEMKAKRLKSVTRHKSFKDKILMMISDSMRAMLLEQRGYKVKIFDFVSSRYTDKNVMVRAVKAGSRRNINIEKEYEYLCKEFKMKPYLEELLVAN